MTSTSQPTSARRAVRFALAAALAGVVLPVVAPGAGVDAGPDARRRSCDTGATATYAVVAGDSWFQIASASGIGTAALLRANDAAAEAALHPGDVLCLPAGASTSTSNSTSPSTSTSSQGPCASKHTVVSGDSWYAISRAVGSSLNGLLEINDATATSVLRPGAQICLPEGTARPAAQSKNAQSTNAQATNAQSCVDKRTVAAGDSWYAISRATGVPIDALVAANDANRTSSLHPGQNLCLPEAGFGRELPSVPLDVGPVRGTCRFANSWRAARDSGRLHVGVDLISPSGTPVVAVANGILTRRTTGGARSGNAWWLTTNTGTYFFYAHLSGFSSGLSVGSHVQAGDVIGYVGSTGNAVSPHLHFEIHPKGGGPINPYSAIWMVGGCNYDRRYEQTPLS